MESIRWRQIIWKEGQYYVAQSLNIDVSSFGRTKKEASENLGEAMALFLEDGQLMARD